MLLESHEKEINWFSQSKNKPQSFTGDFSKKQRKNLKTSAWCFQVTTIRILAIRSQTHLIYLGAVHMIPEWLSFQNEFIPSPYISLYLFTWYRDEISSPHKSFRNEFIPVFNPNEILVLVWHFILVSCKLKTNSVPWWKRKPRSLRWVAHAYRFQDGG